jgi:hypothetical protein
MEFSAWITFSGTVEILSPLHRAVLEFLFQAGFCVAVLGICGSARPLSLHPDLSVIFDFPPA